MKSTSTKKTQKPACPKCQSAMRLISTGSMVRTFSCPVCREITVLKRTDTEALQ
jgi:predicted RNA-binding Zn-ribbon protein involved in translation (DUF1610 family)